MRIAFLSKVGNVIPGMHSRVGDAEHGAPARVLVRRSRYLAAFAAIGCTSKEACARESGLDPKSIYNALKGDVVGNRFMAQTIAALQKDEHRTLLAEIGIEPTLDSLFEVAA